MKIAIVYFSGTGNTKQMVDALEEGFKNKSVEVDVFESDEFSKDNINTYDGFAFGCPSMGDEELEDSSFLPMFESVKDSLGDKPVLLFGSYGWGDGEWMRTWQEDCKDSGINLISDGIICMEEPDDLTIEELHKAVNLFN